MTMMDITNYYLGTYLARYDYMQILLSRFPKEIINKYNLRAMVVYEWMGLHRGKERNVWFETSRHLGQSTFIKTPGAFWVLSCSTYSRTLAAQNQTNIIFTVDDVAVKYVEKDNAEHLRNALLRSYELTTDWGGTVYSDMTLKWDYQK
jgi:hypothetical protein